MKKNVALGPFQVSLLCADAIVLAADEVAHLAEQLRAADDHIGIHRKMGIALWGPRGVHP
jgi:hypothetical protein